MSYLETEQSLGSRVLIFENGVYVVSVDESSTLMHRGVQKRRCTAVRFVHAKSLQLRSPRRQKWTCLPRNIKFNTLLCRPLVSIVRQVCLTCGTETIVRAIRREWSRVSRALLRAPSTVSNYIDFYCARAHAWMHSRWAFCCTQRGRALAIYVGLGFEIVRGEWFLYA